MSCGNPLSIDDVIADRDKDGAYLHMAKTPLTLSNEGAYPQLYVLGFNCGGRPDGLWVSRGVGWLGKARELDNPKFPLCCYIYDIEIDDSAVLGIGNEEDFTAFDKQFPDYWLNFDYFEVDFIDYITGKRIKQRRRFHLDLNKLRKRRGDSTLDMLLHNKIIFKNTADAVKHCEFYRTVNVGIDRFRYKDWSEVAKVYKGVVFSGWDSNILAMNYFWYQSLDVSSGCLWDVSAVKKSTQVYRKIDVKNWERV